MDGRIRLDLALATAAEIEPAAARATARTLDALLACGRGDRDARPPESAWSSSVLSRDGYPVELGFVPGAPGLRYTVELPRRARLRLREETDGAAPSPPPGA